MNKVILYIIGSICLIGAFTIIYLGSFQRATLPVVLISLFALGFSSVACLSYAEVEEWEEGQRIKKVSFKRFHKYFYDSDKFEGIWYCETPNGFSGMFGDDEYKWISFFKDKEKCIEWLKNKEEEHDK